MKDSLNFIVDEIIKKMVFYNTTNWFYQLNLRN